MNLFETFTQKSKAEWIEKIEKDLKGRDISELNIEMANGLVVSPFKHQDDLTTDVRLPRSTGIECQLGISLKVDSEEEANALLIEALEGGSSFIELIIDRDERVDFDILLNGVLMDLIASRFLIATEENKEALREYLIAHYLEAMINQVSLLSLNSSDKDGRLTSVGTCESSNHETLLDVLRKGAEILDAENSMGEEIYVRMNFGHNYIQNITAIRTMRLLWANLCHAYNIEAGQFVLRIEGAISNTAIQEDQYDNMIAFTQIAMGMISGGVDVIYISPSDIYDQRDGTDFSRRISRNIYQLMTLEGQMNVVADPAAGSYLFDSVAVDRAKEIWASLIKERSNE